MKPQEPPEGIHKRVKKASTVDTPVYFCFSFRGSSINTCMSSLQHDASRVLWYISFLSECLCNIVIHWRFKTVQYIYFFFSTRADKKRVISISYFKKVSIFNVNLKKEKKKNNNKVLTSSQVFKFQQV